MKIIKIQWPWSKKEESNSEIQQLYNGINGTMMYAELRFWIIVWIMGFLYTFGKENVVYYGHFWKEILYLVIYFILWPYILGHRGILLP